jgi:hypothetical protein
MEHLLSILYGASGIAAAALYLPQIRKYRREREACLSISILTWSGWIVITGITILYALLVVKSYLFASVATLNVLAQLAVLSYGVRARLVPAVRYQQEWKAAEIVSPALQP